MSTKIKVALIDAKLNLGQVSSSQNKHRLFFLKINCDLLNKGKPGTEHGPKHLKTSYLYDNLNNLRNESTFLNLSYHWSKFHFINSLLDCEVINDDNDTVEDIVVGPDEEIKYYNNKNIHSIGKTNLKVKYKSPTSIILTKDLRILNLI